MAASNGKATKPSVVPAKPARIEAVDHIELDSAVGREAELRWFYGGLLGLAELGETAADELRFTSERIQLHIRLCEQPRCEPIAVRAVFLVRSLSTAAEALTERDMPFHRLHGVSFTDQRLSLLDPAGNRVELKQAWPVSPL